MKVEEEVLVQTMWSSLTTGENPGVGTEEDVARGDDEDEDELKEMKKKLAMRQTLKKTRKMLKSVKTLSGETFGFLRKHCVWI